MSKFKLTPYIVRVRKKNSIESLQLSNISFNNDDDNDLIDVLDDFLEEDNFIKNEGLKKTLCIGPNTKEDRSIYGIIRYGEWGYGADFVNITSEERTTDARTESDSEDYPFFFYFRIPSGKNYGILVLQTFGILKIKTTLENSFAEYIQELSDYDLTTKFHPIVSRDLLEKLETASRIQAVEFIRHDVPTDPFTRHHNNTNERAIQRNEISESRVYAAKRNKSYNRNGLINFLRRFIDTESEYFEIQNETYNQIKVRADFKGSKSTLTLGSTNKIREFYVIPEDIPKEKGFPKEESLLTLTKDYVDGIISKLEGDF